MKILLALSGAAYSRNTQNPQALEVDTDTDITYDGSNIKDALYQAYRNVAHELGGDE
jgi:hypothetical protein